MNTPDMVLFEAPDRLIFVANGKAISVQHTDAAERLFQFFGKAPKDKLQLLIAYVFLELQGNPIAPILPATTLVISPAGEPAGFNRNEETLS